MRSMLGWFFSLTLLVTIGTMGHASTPEKPKLLRDVKTLVTLGDSITQMGGEPGGYVWRLQKYLDALYPNSIGIVNAGISGHKSTDMSERFKRDVLDQKPNIVTISVGVNDVWHGFYDNHPNGDGNRGIDIETYRQKVTEMVEAAQAQGSKVVMLSTTVIYEDLNNKENEKIRGYNRALQEIAASHGCKFVNLYAAFEKAIRAYRSNAGGVANLLTTDGVHLNEAGNQLVAHTILKGFGISEKSLEEVKQSLRH